MDSYLSDSVRSKILSGLLFTLGASLFLLFFVNVKVLIIMTSIIIVFGLFIMKKTPYAIMVSPFLAISFMPGQYTSLFRISSPIGELRADFLLLIVALVFFICINLPKVNINVFKKFKFLFISTFIFFASNVLSIFVNRLSLESFRYSFFIFLFSFGVLMLVALSQRYINPKDILKSFTFMSTIVCVLGILEFFNISRPYTSYYLAENPWFSYVQGTNNLRIASSIGNPLVLSTFILLMLSVVLFLREQSDRKILWNIITLLHVITILFTQSRSTYLVMAVVLIYYSASNIKKFVNNISLIGFSSVLFYTILKSLGAGQIFIDRLLFKSQAESYSIRKSAFSIARQLLSEKNNMLIGLGPNMVNVNLMNRQSFVTTLDNVFLMNIVSLGIIGFISFLFIFLTVWSMFNKTEKHIKKTGNSLLITIIGMGFSFNITYFTSVWGVFWFIISLLLLFDINIKKNSARI